MEKIVYDSWGYNMTIVDFYKVVRETEKSIFVVPIASVETADGYLTGRSMPDPTRVLSDKVSCLRKRGSVSSPNEPTRRYYKGTLHKTNQSLEGHLVEDWDGKSKYFNHCD